MQCDELGKRGGKCWLDPRCPWHFACSRLFTEKGLELPRGDVNPGGVPDPEDEDKSR